MSAMGGNDKKTRADNFSEEDKGLLLSLIADHVMVLECRKTDHKNNSAKYKAWAAISKKFHRRASHPRNFTQMKDLYRRLKLKAKKDVGMWLKACAEAGTDSPLPSSQVQPDNTSFLVYDMIQPYKGELNPEDEEQERLLAVALKIRELNASFTKNDASEENIAKSDWENTEITDNEVECDPNIKEEPVFDYVPPHIVDTRVVEHVETIEPAPRPLPQQSIATASKRVVEKHRNSASVMTNALRRQMESPNDYDPAAKRRCTFPGLERHSMPSRPNSFASAFANRRRPWIDASSAYRREGGADKHRDGDNEDVTAGMSPYEEGMFQMAQAEHKAKMLVLQTQRRAETSKEEAYKMIWQNAQLQRDLLQLQYENVL